mgnify:FL=1
MAFHYWRSVVYPYMRTRTARMAAAGTQPMTEDDDAPDRTACIPTAGERAVSPGDGKAGQGIVPLTDGQWTDVVDKIRCGHRTVPS